MRHSLEARIRWLFALVCGLVLGLLVWVMVLLEASTLMTTTVVVIVFLPVILSFDHVYRRLFGLLNQVSTAIETLRAEDYSLRLHHSFDSGIARDIQGELSQLAEALQTRKHLYDQSSFLVFRLIEQLDSPIAVFDQNLKLIHANAAFSQFIRQPWESQRRMHCQHFGLGPSEKAGWTLDPHPHPQGWQTRSSLFVKDGQTHHLVVLINIEKELRTKQLEAWRQIMRVLSHEIRNSLTPIKSLAQSMQGKVQGDERMHKALGVIIDRSVSLQEFVGRYGSLNEQKQLQLAWFEPSRMFAAIEAMFPGITWQVAPGVKEIWADPVLIEQVMLNLVKNGWEAQSEDPEVTISLKRMSSNIMIDILDNGTGITSPDNLFIPFYTTKRDGKGIGLCLCQNIVEQHQGTLHLTNRDDRRGAKATIMLPQPPGKSMA
ncbi:Histidine kinase domain-containing protein [Sulfidibacter corallicola]|uniref:histidine kinase n=1 Tax=Sulfidibacter corallicola TaxID=2818388 RepID=A0A8A4TPV0_SULCO|nr:ATP-binding protein [Sulfidibacter corallicola]QTD50941.1 hypothetical protein J3U87_00600 [Sulfidibacter corallicola]